MRYHFALYSTFCNKQVRYFPQQILPLKIQSDIYWSICHQPFSCIQSTFDIEIIISIKKVQKDTKVEKCLQRLRSSALLNIMCLQQYTLLFDTIYQTKEAGL